MPHAVTSTTDHPLHAIAFGQASAASSIYIYIYTSYIYARSMRDDVKAIGTLVARGTLAAQGHGFESPRVLRRVFSFDQFETFINMYH